jgi:ATP-dependent RNA helicase DDX27
MKELDLFVSEKVEFILCTDVASRGLDIPGIKTVINYDAPRTYEIYLHRVGRTARAGRSGRSVTLATESDRKILKIARKQAKSDESDVLARLVPNDELEEIALKLNELEETVQEVLIEEKEEKALKIAERDVKKGENVIKYQDEIMARPKRTWFATEREKASSKGI